MTDRYRWRFAAIVCTLVATGGFLMDTWPLYQSAKQKQIEEAVLINRLRDLQRMTEIVKLNQHPMPAFSETGVTSQVPLLAVVTDAAHAVGAQLISMYQMPSDDEKGVFGARAKYVLNGTYQALMSVMMGLQGVSNHLLIRNFTIKMIEQGGYVLLLDVSLLNVGSVPSLHAVIEKQHDAIRKLRNPFCAEDGVQAGSAQPDQARLQSVSVGSLQMAGYVHQGNQTAAWIRLPEGEIVQVVQGDVIGREQAQVNVIAQDRVMLMSAAGMSMRISSAGGAHV